MQAICDARRRFLDVEIQNPGATSDYLAFALSNLHKKLEGTNHVDESLPFLRPGLALYGDNAYVNTAYMVTPFKAAVGKAKDAFNFYLSQLRITIECAFGMLVHRWGILRRAMPLNISLTKTVALVIALCKLHNFCIDENETILQPVADDTIEIALNGGIDLRAFNQQNNDSTQNSRSDGVVDTPEIYTPETEQVNDLLNGGENMDDVSSKHRRQLYRGAEASKTPFPFQVMLQYVEEQGYERLLGGRRLR